MRGLLLIVVLVLTGTLAQTTQAKILDPVKAFPVDELVLEKDATISVHTYIGELACREGRLIEVSPEAKFLYNYGEKDQTVTLPEKGFYPKGTKLVFEIQPANCGGNTWVSFDHMHAIIEHLDQCNWRITWEDLTDLDFNDLYTEVYVCGPATKPADPPAKVDPVYKLPWPAPLAHKVTNWPGNKGTDHYQTSPSGQVVCCRAYDFGMHIGDFVSASSDGTVLWVEDGHGPGGCNRIYINDANAVLIQPDGVSEVNTLYLHLLAGSITVKEGDRVKQGQIIAQAGISGYTCNAAGTGPGPHLHFEWVHHCFDLVDVAKRRSNHLGYYCGPFVPEAPYQFTWNGHLVDLVGLGTYNSDNQAP